MTMAEELPKSNPPSKIAEKPIAVAGQVLPPGASFSIPTLDSNHIQDNGVCVNRDQMLSVHGTIDQGLAIHLVDSADRNTSAWCRCSGRLYRLGG